MIKFAHSYSLVLKDQELFSLLLNEYESDDRPGHPQRSGVLKFVAIWSDIFSFLHPIPTEHIYKILHHFFLFVFKNKTSKYHSIRSLQNRLNSWCSNNEITFKTEKSFLTYKSSQNLSSSLSFSSNQLQQAYPFSSQTPANLPNTSIRLPNLSPQTQPSVESEKNSEMHNHHKQIQQQLLSVQNKALQRKQTPRYHSEQENALSSTQNSNLPQSFIASKKSFKNTVKSYPLPKFSSVMPSHTNSIFSSGDSLQDGNKIESKNPVPKSYIAITSNRHTEEIFTDVPPRILSKKFGDFQNFNPKERSMNPNTPNTPQTSNTSLPSSEKKVINKTKSEKFQKTIKINCKESSNTKEELSTFDVMFSTSRENFSVFVNNFNLNSFVWEGVSSLYSISSSESSPSTRPLSSPCPPTFKTDYIKEKKEINFIDLNIKDVAKQLTLLDHFLLKQITNTELVLYFFFFFLNFFFLIFTPFFE